MTLMRLCDVCGRKLNTDVMDYATISSKSHSKDICNIDLEGALRITYPGNIVVSGFAALTGDFSPAEEVAPSPYHPNPATQDNPQI